MGNWKGLSFFILLVLLLPGRALTREWVKTEDSDEMLCIDLSVKEGKDLLIFTVNSIDEKCLGEQLANLFIGTTKFDTSAYLTEIAPFTVLPISEKSSSDKITAYSGYTVEDFLKRATLEYTVSSQVKSIKFGWNSETWEAVYSENIIYGNTTTNATNTMQIYANGTTNGTYWRGGANLTAIYNVTRFWTTIHTNASNVSDDINTGNSLASYTSGTGQLYSFFTQDLNTSCFSPVSLNSGLISYYNTDEPSGTVMIDSLNLQNGTINGALVNQVGKINRTYNYVTNDWTSVTNLNGLNLTGNFTISHWIYFDNLPVNDLSYIGNAFPSTQKGWMVYYSTTGDDKINFFGYGLSDTNVISTTTPVADTWYHVVVTYNGTRLALWINGAIQDDDASTGAITGSTRAVWFARYEHAPDYNLTGNIDEIGFWNRALTPAEINASLYNFGTGLACGGAPYTNPQYSYYNLTWTTNGTYCSSDSNCSLSQWCNSTTPIQNSLCAEDYITSANIIGANSQYDVTDSVLFQANYTYGTTSIDNATMASFELYNSSGFSLSNYTATYDNETEVYSAYINLTEEGEDFDLIFRAEEQPYYAEATDTATFDVFIFSLNITFPEEGAQLYSNKIYPRIFVKLSNFYNSADCLFTHNFKKSESFTVVNNLTFDERLINLINGENNLELECSAGGRTLITTATFRTSAVPDIYLLGLNLDIHLLVQETLIFTKKLLFSLRIPLISLIIFINLAVIIAKILIRTSHKIYEGGSP
jgi:hypothetical protein